LVSTHFYDGYATRFYPIFTNLLYCGTVTTIFLSISENSPLFLMQKEEDTPFFMGHLL